MKFYIHKITDKPMASMDDLFDFVTGDNSTVKSQAERVGGCITRVVFPNKWLGDGISFHVMHYRDLSKFKRIKKEKFFELCPDFGQLRHWADNTIERHSYEKLFQDIPKRKLTLGTGNPNEITYENTIGK